MSRLTACLIVTYSKLYQKYAMPNTMPNIQVLKKCISNKFPEMDVFQSHQNPRSLEMVVDQNFQHLELAYRLP